MLKRVVEAGLIGGFALLVSAPVVAMVALGQAEAKWRPAYEAKLEQGRLELKVRQAAIDEAKARIEAGQLTCVRPYVRSTGLVAGYCRHGLSRSL